jgi:hypothetical protein
MLSLEKQAVKPDTVRVLFSMQIVHFGLIFQPALAN